MFSETAMNMVFVTANLIGSCHEGYSRHILHLSEQVSVLDIVASCAVSERLK